MKAPDLFGGLVIKVLFILRAATLVFLAAGFCRLYIEAASAADIWFSPTDPLWRNVRGWPPNDYMGLFRSDAPWPKAASQVKVFEISKRFVLESSDEEIGTLIAGLKQRHIALSVQATPLTANLQCGLGIESYGPPDDMMMVAAKLKRLGADLKYMTMDEPLWFGHRFDRKLGSNDKPNTAACHSSITEIARQTAAKMKLIRGIYPSITIGDDEPLGITSVSPNDWVKDLNDWIIAYRGAMGEPLGYFHADVVWLEPAWRNVLPRIVPSIRAAHIPLGVIYNGTPSDPSDSAWLDDAESHFRLIEGTMHIMPEHAILQSWMDRPRQILPETQPATLTNLVLRYSAWQLQSTNQK